MTKVKWHPYLKEKPKDFGWFLVSAEKEDPILDDGVVSFVSRDFFEPNYGWYECRGSNEVDNDPETPDVIAWAELPEPYKEIEDDTTV